jgi:hypothetical protein
MVTVSGRQIWPLDPKEEEVEIGDIAHALSNICRFGGHVKEFYSVAQHCLLVAACVPKEDQRWALLHDAAEAYMGDMVRPIKRFMPNFKEAEERLLRVIGVRFGLTWPMPESIHVADNLVLGAEARDLMPALCERERRNEAPLGLVVDPLEPDMARSVYLDTFHRLFGRKG